MLQIVTPESKKVKVDTLTKNIFETNIKYGARDSIRIEPEEEKIYLFGVADVEYDGFTLNADYIEINNKENIVTAYGRPDSTGKIVGKPKFNDGENNGTCEKIVFNTKTKKGKITGLLTKQADMLLYGESIKKDTDNVMSIKNVKCIPCEYEDAMIYFRATKAKVIPNDKIVTGPIFLEISGIPTPLALPFGYFPNVKNKSKAGILMPTYGESPALGFFLKDGGFYLPINNKIDMEFKGDIYSTGSWGLGHKTRYTKRYAHNGELLYSYNIFKNGEPEVPSLYSIIKTFKVAWRHTQDAKWKPNVRFSASVNIQSNQNNKYTAYNAQQYLSNQLYSNISYSKTFKNSNLSINARHSQNTILRTIDVALPELTFATNRFYPFKNKNHIKSNVFDKIQVNYTSVAKANVQTLDSTFFTNATLDKIKYGVSHSIPISTNINLFKYITFTPSVNLSSNMYLKTLRKIYDAAADSIIDVNKNGFAASFDTRFSAALGTTIYGNYIFKKGKVKHIRHQMQPRLSYDYRPDFGKDFWGFYDKVQKDSLGNYETYSIFTNTLFGGPSIGKSSSLSLALSNMLDAKVRVKTDSSIVDKKISILQNIDFSGSYNFAADSIRMSNFGITGRTKIWKNINLLFGGTFDPYVHDATTNAKINTSIWDYEKRIARFSNGSIAISSGFSPSLFTKNGKPLTGDWSFNINYNLLLNQSWTKKITYTQTLSLNGNVTVTKNWKLNFVSNYDFAAKSFSYTSFSIFRDLRCWEAHIDWVPFGFRKRYAIGINLKTSALSSIKIPRTREWYDNL